MTCNEIRALRESLKLSQPQFAKILGISNILVSKLETGRRAPTSKDLERLNEVKMLEAWKA